MRYGSLRSRTGKQESLAGLAEGNVEALSGAAAGIAVMCRGHVPKRRVRPVVVLLVTHDAEYGLHLRRLVAKAVPVRSSASAPGAGMTCIRAEPWTISSGL